MSRLRLGAALVAAAFAGCGSPPQPVAPPPLVKAKTKTAPAAAPTPPAPSQLVHYEHIDQYKRDAADHMVSKNPDHIFSGALPPLLPAIVVMSITINRDGKVVHTRVVRSRDTEASKVATEAIQQASPLPKPFNLVAMHDKDLTYSETFLFNAQYRFQVRSIAPVQ
ncbi:MAG: TonB C-terminal domain-containing protein [Pseudomonadota bacterium]